jgi:hypothetical protein
VASLRFGFALSALTTLAACLGPRTPTCDSAEASYQFDVPAALSPSTTLLEAEDATTTGNVSKFSTALHTPGAEASGRRFVALAPGQSVTWQSPVSADGVVVRYSYPDAADGGGRDGALELHVGSGAAATLAVTSRYSWEYGKPAWGSSDVWSSEPARGSPRHFWDEASMRLPTTVAPGTTVSLTNPAASGQTIAIDFVELERVPEPLTAPEGSLSFADFAPAADGNANDSAKLERALAEATKAKRVLYVPPGTYRIDSVTMSGGTLQGAGFWHTRFVGPKAQIRFGGGRAHVRDFALFGETAKRNDHSDEGNGFTGLPGPGSSIERIWVEHMKCAFWVSNAGQERGPSALRISGCRFRNLMADAVNLCNGTTQATVDNNHVRNTGDDALAAWSPGKGTPAGGHNTFAHNDIQSPWVASGIALYGGGPFRVIGNTVKDTVTTGSGVYVSANFGAHPFRGLVEVSGNVVVRGGAHESDPGGPTGAFRVLAGDQDMTDAEFLFRDNTARAPLESAVSIQGPRRITGLRFEGLVVEDAPLVADVRPGARGEAAFSDVSAGAATFRNPDERTFTLTR